jgi:hypothetical protein
VPAGAGLLPALAILPGPLGGERKRGERDTVPINSTLGIGSKEAHQIDAILVQSKILRFLLPLFAGHPAQRPRGFCSAISQQTTAGTRRATFLVGEGERSALPQWVHGASDAANCPAIAWCLGGENSCWCAEAILPLAREPQMARTSQACTFTPTPATSGDQVWPWRWPRPRPRF